MSAKAEWHLLARRADGKWETCRIFTLRRDARAALKKAILDDKRPTNSVVIVRRTRRE